jgi:predicted ATPase
LGEAAVLQFQRNLVGQRSGDEMSAGRLHQATGGNPFFIIETLHKLVEEGRLEQYFQGSLQFTLPESIQEALQARVQRLSPIARQVLEVGAVLGQSFGIDLLRLTAGRSHVEIMIALEELVARILLVEAPLEYRFINELTRQHVEESLGQVRRQLLHLRAGKAHLRLDPEAFPILAHHFEWGGDLQKALHYHELAARQAHALFAWQVVEFHYGHMLELLTRSRPDQQ